MPQAAVPMAIIGVAGRFPEAASVHEFWENLRNGRESIRFIEASNRRASADQAFVPAVAMLEGYDLFDASFFGYTARQAELLDPQQRLLLETAWTALENAGYDADRFPGPIGVFAGATLNTYLYSNLLRHAGVAGSVDPLELNITNGPDFLTTRLSYKLNLKGPSHGVQCACSTSLVAVHNACESLARGESDMALAGGVSLNLMFRNGYHRSADGITSPDGHCRTFDAAAAGTIFGAGVAMVVLKRLDDAVASRDSIVAVIRGSAVNNDGGFKVGYTAPSIHGQTEVIATALTRANVSASSIGYVEAHGTATPLGDPIEVQALTNAYRRHTPENQFCGIGSVKTNVGHLDAAAGVTGLIKAALMVRHGELVPSLHFTRPNPEIDFPHSPFYVVASRAKWSVNGQARRAGVSAFGVGGTNAHVIIEEPPAVVPSHSRRPAELLVMSAKTKQALDVLTADVDGFLSSQPTPYLADAAYTFATGRKAFAHRRIQVRRYPDSALSGCADGYAATGAKRVAFVFPGQGSQRRGMSAAIYEAEPVFRETFDQCCGWIRQYAGIDLPRILHAADSSVIDEDTAITQLSLFAVEYSLGQLWLSWGIRPDTVLGHSLGEYVAASIAGVFTPEDAIRVLAGRGALMDATAAGAMLSVALSESEVAELGLAMHLAAVNAAQQCVLSGPPAAVLDAERQLGARGISCRRLRGARAFHSVLMDPVLEPFRALMATVRMNPAAIPIVSNLTGRIGGAEMAAADYWVEHLRRPVRFRECVETLFQSAQPAVVEIGPGDTLTRLLRRSPACPREATVLCCMGPDPAHEYEQVLTAAGQMWASGVALDWDRFYGGESRRRIPCPTYAFERQRYWIEAPEAAAATRTYDPAEDSAPVCGYSWHQQLTYETAAVEGVCAFRVISVDSACAWPRLLRGAFRSRGREVADEAEPSVVIVCASGDSSEQLEQVLAATDRRSVCYVLLSRSVAVTADEDLEAGSIACLGIAERHHARVLDVRTASERTARSIVAHILAGGGDKVMAFRLGARWMRQSEPFTSQAHVQPSRIILTGDWNDAEMRTWETWATHLHSSAPVIAPLGGDRANCKTIATDSPTVLYFGAGARLTPEVVERLRAFVADYGAGRCILIPIPDGREPAYVTSARFQVVAHVENRSNGAEWSSVEWHLPDNVPGPELPRGMQDALSNFTRCLEMVQGTVVLRVARGAADSPGMPAGGHARPRLITPFVAPAGDMEAQVAEVWEAVLGIQGIGALDNFFELGGDSLIAMQCTTGLEAALRQPVAVAMLYDAPTVRALVTALERLGAVDTDAAERARRAAGRREFQMKARQRQSSSA